MSQLQSGCCCSAPVKSSEPSVSSRPLTKEQSSSSQTAAETWLEEAHREAGFSKPYTELSASQQEQLQQRAAYLRQQRDKLHALKKEQQKTKQTATSEEAPSNPAPAPTTTPEAVGQPQRNGACTPPLPAPPPPQAQHSANSSKQKEISAEERKKLQKRKHLADKLKNIIITTTSGLRQNVEGVKKQQERQHSTHIYMYELQS
ncbi:cilia- and flagella-associated protein 36 isoform X1 [Lates japonicus]|uniref:Cilia- and flagella-associated protein 36 isoform X1 n=1 Tax=Lates japonicus TaxID=270547 RepID=A0AAD3N2Q7_LATJO|nr:cilia- and flagella-associated protein 36 isoform X1 [Lates japonicus]GLD64743.1 cilia- and flagella-associated protein 36 isoform X1 [Lates japonicus]